MDALLRSLLRRGLRRGVVGGERAWLVIAASAFLLRAARKSAQKRKQPELVFSDKMDIGERLLITHRPPSGKNRRREGPAAQP